MTFENLAQTFDAIEQLSSRLAITEQLASLLQRATPHEASMITYLSLGELYPSYQAIPLNIAEKTMCNVLARVLSTTRSAIEQSLHETGDLGLVIQKSTWPVPHGQTPKTLPEVHEQLCQILAITGTGSQELKEEKMVALLLSLDQCSAKYVMRIIVGKLRLGFSDMTLLDAFSWMMTGDKSLRSVLEHAYNISADLGHIAFLLKKEGVDALANIHITPGIPIRPAAAERLNDAAEIIKKLGPCSAQPKLDGLRIQVHIWRDEEGAQRVSCFSRNLKDMSGMFPEIIHAVLLLPVETCVIEGEAIAYDATTHTYLPFQETAKRRRKYDIEEIAGDLPLQFQVFDILYLDGVSLLTKTHATRRKMLENLLASHTASSNTLRLIEEKEVETAEELETYFLNHIEQGFEGLVIKKPASHYQPGKRNFNWIKLKRQETGHLDDTIDCVILGYYAGQGKRASFGIGALLVGVYNNLKDRFETVAKIGTGLTDIEWKEVKQKCDDKKVATQPFNVICAKELVPDCWVAPEIVCSIRADEITLSPLHKAGATETKVGYALRFPRFMGYRYDKGAPDATTVKELEHLFQLQFNNKSSAQEA